MRRPKYVPILVLALCASTLVMTTGRMCHGDQPSTLEILYMNHGPMQPTIRNLKSLIGRFPGKVRAIWFDFDKQSGKDFMRSRGVKGHIPLLIYINGVNAFELGGRRVSFIGFPTGSGPYHVQGKWTLQDLERVIVSLSR